MTDGDVVSLGLIIPGFVPDSRLSLNGRNRTHWTVIRKLRTQVESELDKVALVAWPLPMFGRARVEVMFVYPTKRRRDPDGLAGMVKPILDRLVSYGVLRDDSADEVELTVTAVVEPRVLETRICIAGKPDVAP